MDQPLPVWTGRLLRREQHIIGIVIEVCSSAMFAKKKRCPHAHSHLPQADRTVRKTNYESTAYLTVDGLL
jgi:hypothetical protein